MAGAWEWCFEWGIPISGWLIEWQDGVLRLDSLVLKETEHYGELHVRTYIIRSEDRQPYLTDRRSLNLTCEPKLPHADIKKRVPQHLI